MVVTYKSTVDAGHTDPIVEVYDQLWVDQFVPQDEVSPVSDAMVPNSYPAKTDLAVHKRKVEDVRRWLVDALESPKLRKYRVRQYSIWHIFLLTPILTITLRESSL